MSILSFLLPSSPESKSEWNQSQREALVDLLYLAIYADNHLSQLEEIAIKDELRLATWEQPSLDLYINDAIKRARDARENPGFRSDYLDQIADRLKTSQARSNALSALEKILRSDGADKREETFLAEVRSHFQLPSER